MYHRVRVHFRLSSLALLSLCVTIGSLLVVFPSIVLFWHLIVTKLNMPQTNRLVFFEHALLPINPLTCLGFLWIVGKHSTSHPELDTEFVLWC